MSMASMEKHLFNLKFAAKELERNSKKCDKVLTKDCFSIDKMLRYWWKNTRPHLDICIFTKSPGVGRISIIFFKYILGRESRKAETEESNWKRKHGGDFEMIPATNWLDYVLGCQNSCRECNSAEKPISELLENVCKVTKQAIFIPFFNLI